MQSKKLSVSCWKCRAYLGTFGSDVAFLRLASATAQMAGLRDEHVLDAEQSDAAAGAGGICGGESIWSRRVGEPCGGGADGGIDRTGCAGWTYRAYEEAGNAFGRASRHFGRPDDRERVLHLFCGGGNGVPVATGVFLCARGGDGFSSRARDARGAFGMGSERDATDLVGTGSGGFAMEPRDVRRDEVSVLLLFGIGAGADARTSSVNWGVSCGR